MSKAQTHQDPHPEPTGWAVEEGLTQPRCRGRDVGVWGWQQLLPMLGSSCPPWDAGRGLQVL